MEKEITAEYLLLQNVTEIPTLWVAYMQKAGLGCICGASDTGKSAFLRQLAMCVAAGRDKFLGIPLHPIHRSVIYVSTEDDALATAYLLYKQNKDLKIPVEELRGLRFIFDATDLLQQLEERLTAQPADLIIIDCFADLYYGNINESNQVRTFLQQYLQLAERHQCLVLFLHHCGKRTEDLPPSKHHLLGSQAFEGKMRLVFELRTDIDSNQYKHLCCVKGNYLSQQDKSASIKLKFQENMTFENTGLHVPFDLLVKSDKQDAVKYDRIKELQSQGKTQDEIAEEFGYSDKSGICKWVSRYEKKHPECRKQKDRNSE